MFCDMSCCGHEGWSALLRTLLTASAATRLEESWSRDRVRLRCTPLQGAAPDLFFAGLRGYLRQHQCGNAAASDLWSALSGPTGGRQHYFKLLWPPHMPVLKHKSLSGCAQ